jgi:RHS repeat-associated protein
VATNGPLGEGGWRMFGCGSGLIFVPLCFESSRPHYVTVTWPDGRLETFDLTPAKGSTFLPGLTAAKFTAGLRTTSALEAVDSSLYFSNGDLLGGFFGSGGIYDPQRFRLTSREGTVYLLDRTAGLVSATDRNGNTLTVSPTGVTSSLGPSITFARDAHGRITRVTGPSNEVITYDYDAAGDLRTVTEGPTTFTYSYNANHGLQVSKAGGQAFQTLTYGPDGRLATISDSTGRSVEVEFDVAARQETFTTASGLLTTVNTYDARGNVTRIDEVSDGRTLTSSFTYDALGRPITSLDPLEHETKAEWSADGDLTKVTDAAGNFTTFTYGEFGELLTQVAPGGVTVLTNTYDDAGNLIRADRAGRIYRYEYDGGRVAKITDPLLRELRFEYTPEGRVATITGHDGRVRGYTYDASGRTLTIVEPGGATSEFGYDPIGNLTTVTDALGRVHRYEFDAFQRITKDTDALGRATTYVYDAAGRLEERRDRNGAVTTYGYDADGLLASKTLPGDIVTTYSYDPLGRLTRAENPDSLLEYAYDDVGNLVTQHTTATAGSPQPDVTLSYAYDQRDAPSTLTSPAGEIQFTFDPRLRLDTITDPQGGVFDLSFDDGDRLTGFTRPNGVADTFDWDDADQLSSRRATQGSSVLAESAYTYDAGGRRRALADTFGTHAFTVDERNRLTTSTHPAGSAIPAESYTYDAVGNRTSWPGSPAGSVSIDDANHLLSDGRYDYTYDQEGNLTRRVDRGTGATTTYDWNADHQLLAVHLPGGSTSQYRYDPLGRRIEVVTAATITRYVYDGPNVLLEYDGANDLTTSYVTGMDAGPAFELRRGDESTYPLTDGLGSTVASTDAAGSVTETYRYSSFGVPVGPSAGTYAFTGHQYDAETGLYYARARFYDPAIGRFLSEDPIPAINAYPYVDNDPVDLIDPYGAQPLGESALQHARTAIYRAALGQLESSCCMQLVKMAALGLSGGGANALGAAGEAFVGQALGINHGGRIQVPGTNRFRIPDFNLYNRLVEVKNTKYLSLTSQIQDYIRIAGPNNPVTIVTRAGTQLSGPLLQAIKAGTVRIIGCLPGQ